MARSGRPQVPIKPSEEHYVQVGPYLGMDRLNPPGEVGPRYSPDAVNFDVEDGWLRVRDGVANVATSSESGGGLSTALPRASVVINSRLHVFFENVQLGYTLGVAANPNGCQQFISWSSMQTRDATFSDSAFTRQIQVVVCPDTQDSSTSWLNATCFAMQGSMPNPFFFRVPSNDSVYASRTSSNWSLTPFTAHFSITSKAAFPASINERLVLYGLDNPQRVAWSVRGAPRDFSSEGAGFIDTQIGGTARASLIDGDRLVLLSSSEVWEARARADSYAFDFRKLGAVGSPAENTAAATPFGPVWLGADRQLYILQGDTITPIARGISNYMQERWTPAVNTGASWSDVGLLPMAVYDVARRDYLLFWHDWQYSSDRTEGGYNANAPANNGYNSFFRVNLEKCLQRPLGSATGPEAWTVHRFSADTLFRSGGSQQGGGAGVNGLVLGGATAVPIVQTTAGQGNIPTDFGGVQLMWNGAGYSGSLFNFGINNVGLLTNNPWQPSSAVTSIQEWGANVQAYWTTPVLGQNDLQKETIASVWMDYQSPATSVVSILAADDGRSFTTIGALTLTPTSYSTLHRPTSQYSTAYAPLTSQPYRGPQLRFVAAAAAPGGTRIGRIRIGLNSYTGKF